MKVLAATALSFAVHFVYAEESGKSALGPLVEFNIAITAVMKMPIALATKDKKNDSFCIRPEMLNKTVLKKMQISCERIFNDPALPEIQRVAAKYILGKTKTLLNTKDITPQFCIEAVSLLSSVADYYDQKSIPGNGPHEAMANCLVENGRYESALAWIERGLKRKETSQIQYLAGVSWQNLQELSIAKTAYERAIALNDNNKLAKEALVETDLLIKLANSADTPQKNQISMHNNPECKAWKAAIISNRKDCDIHLNKSFDEFFSCMDVGMTFSGYGPRSDEKTQNYYHNCGLSSWTDESLQHSTTEAK